VGRLFRLIGAMALLATATAVAAQVRPFDANSMSTIRAEHPGKPFVLAFWSLYCQPCREEMGVWGELQRKHPQVAIILVATDPAEDRVAVAELLRQHKLGKVETWIFADGFEERVRYALDPAWRGELPRTYLFDAGHRAEGRSGRVDAKWMSEWLAAQSEGARIGLKKREAGVPAPSDN
jgi:thiol-disulfide isomerase/thioredoxin